MNGNKNSKKIFCLLVIICFLTLSFNNSIADNSISDISAELSYGFIVSSIIDGNYTKIDKTNCKIRHMINDFLRNEIPVFWNAEELSVKIKKINSSQINEELLGRGSYIIPFTGNSTDNKKIISIIYDYNKSSEIEINDNISVPTYYLLEKLEVKAYQLNKVKIAQIFHRITSGGFLFLQLLTKCGFLDYNPLLDKDVYKKLKNDDYNVVFHPGRFNIINTIPHDLFSDLLYRTSDGIRSFVKNGGGYIGCCGGLIRAGAGGYTPFIYFKRNVYNPNLRSFIVLSIADLLIKPPPQLNTAVQVKLINNSSPITFGLDEILWDSWYGGHHVFHTGENVEVIGEFYNTGTVVDETPVWITAKFGKGKVAAFTTHPEIAGVSYGMENESQLNNGKTVISNSLFYLTADEKIEHQTIFSKSLSYIKNIFNLTENLTKNITDISHIFNPFRDKINKTKLQINSLSNNFSEILSNIRDIASKNNVNLSQKNNK